MNIQTPAPKLTAKDYASDQEVRWCPGCGDYAILKAVQKTLAEAEAAREKTVFVSGIGCSSRFPYYMSTYGFHTIHGRAPAVATGVKLANPELDVWIVTGDGDGLSIGGNHLMHLLRRNVDVQLLLFNNEVYGLTKGQYSPTSQPGMVSPSTPLGSVDAPLQPCRFALGSGAKFVARSIDTQQKHLVETFHRARGHTGTSFVEILQNCIIYNDGIFDNVTNKKTAPDHVVVARHGEALIFGQEREKCLRLNTKTLAIEVALIGENGITEDDALIHDETNSVLAGLLAELGGDGFPTVIGTLYCAPAETFETALLAQVTPVAADSNAHEDIREVLMGGRTWQVDTA